MTTPVSGSSLPQARDVHQHNHFHNSRDSRSRHYQHTHHNHNNHHARSQNSNDSSKRGHKRTESDEPTIIVETVSVLQIIDSSGATVTLQTLTPSGGFTPATTINPGPDTTTVDPATESASAPGFSSTSTATSDDAGADSSTTTSASTIDPTVAPSESSMPTSFPTLSYSPLTSTPLSGSSVFPSLAGVTNTTQGPSLSSSSSSQSSSSFAIPTTTSLSVSDLSEVSSSSSTSFTSNSTSSTSTTSILSFSAESINSSSTPSVLSSSSSLFSDSSSSTSATTTTSSGSSSASITSDSSTAFASSTGSGGDGVGLGGNVQPSSSSTSTADGASGSSSSGPGAATVAGSVLGGVAALAALLILALYLLRWKKRQNTKQLMRGSGSERGPGGALVGNSGPSGGGNAGSMSETRRSAPFAIPAALASLTGHKRSSARSGASSDGGERGFSKVSGRKLPPVIQFGGDGYSDPRDTIMSDQSIEYRDSQAFPGLSSTGPTRLAVGAPMRPESGIPVYNPGPARTPITEQAPYTPDTSPLEPPPRDPLGPSRPSQDGSNRSHVSVSRFTEVL